MNNQKIIVDRIENGLAVCELDGGEVVDIPLDRISGSVKEGDVLCENEGAGYFVSQEETELRRSAIQDRFDRLKSRKK